jgi:hypothetical protein
VATGDRFLRPKCIVSGFRPAVTGYVGSAFGHRTKNLSETLLPGFRLQNRKPLLLRP